MTKKILLCICAALTLSSASLMAQEEQQQSQSTRQQEEEYIYMTPAQMRADARARAKEWREQQKLIRPHYPWVITVGGGADMFIGETDALEGYADRLATPAVEFNMSKWLLPWVGLGGSVTGYQIKGLSALSTDPEPFFHTDELVEVPNGFDTYYRQSGRYINAHIDLMFNLFRLFGGEKMFHTFNIIPYVGFGLIHDFEDYGPTASTVNAGIVNSIHITDALAVNLTVRGLATHDLFDGEPSQVLSDRRQIDAMLSATAGISFSFGMKK